MILSDDQIRIAREEARRLVAIGIPKWMMADEVQSEAYMILVSNAGLFGANLRMMVRRRLVRFLRIQRVQRITVASEGRAIDQGSDNGSVWDQIDTEILDDRERLALSMIYFMGLTEEEAAIHLAIDQSSVARIIRGAIEKLRPVKMAA